MRAIQWLPGVTLLSLLCACQPSGVPQKLKSSGAPLPTDRPATADEVVASDPCSSRLHDIEGALLMYYAVNKRMPLVLEEIKPYADAGTQLVLTCPVSNLPYAYSAEGLLAAGTERRMIVWDSTPAHHGLRWCIVMPRPAQGSVLVPEVIPITEKAFEAFMPMIQ